MTLAELQAATGYSMPTVRNAVQELEDTGWICTVGQDASTGGRPARLLGLNGETHLSVGTHVEIPMVNMVVAALDGRIVEQQCFSKPEGLLPDDVVKSILTFVGQVRERYPARRLLGIGMAAPGYLDTSSGTILYVGRAPGWENYPMRVRLMAGLGLPIVMENDTDCLIRAEMAFADLPTEDNIVYLGVLEGVKVSMMLNGRVYNGPFGNAGLIGRTKVAHCQPAAGEVVYADLEETAAVGGVCNQFERRVGAWPERDETIRHILSITEHDDKFHAILNAAEAGHPLCCEVIGQMLDDLTLAIANLIYILQPVVLVIGGALSSIPKGIARQLEGGIRSKLPSLLSHHLVISYATMNGRYAAATGAAHLFLQRYLTMEEARTA